MNLSFTSKHHAHLQILTKTHSKFQKEPAKTVGVACKRHPVFKCFKPKMSPNCKKVTNINLRVTAKHHAHLQTLTKTPTTFQKDPAKTVAEVAVTRFCDGQSDRQTNRQADRQTDIQAKAICLPILSRET